MSPGLSGDLIEPDDGSAHVGIVPLIASLRIVVRVSTVAEWLTK